MPAALVGIVLVAFNLRTAVASLSPILPPRCNASAGPPGRRTLGMLTAAMLVSAPDAADRRALDLEPTLIVALVALSAGPALAGLAGDRARAGFAAVDPRRSPPSASASVSAAAAFRVIELAPSTWCGALDGSIYVSRSLGSARSRRRSSRCPVADAAGWRALARRVGRLVAPPLLSCRGCASSPTRPQRPGPPCPRRPSRGLLRYAVRSPLARALTVVFTITGLNAYALFAWLPSICADDIAGDSPAEAGALLSLYAAIGLPAGLIVPIVAAVRACAIARRRRDRVVHRPGYLGLLLAPPTATWLWVALAGLGPLLFPLSLVLINLRSRTHSGAVALSASCSRRAYLIVAVGPLPVGVLLVTGEWVWPLVLPARGDPPCPPADRRHGQAGRGSSRTLSARPPTARGGCRLGGTRRRGFDGSAMRRGAASVTVVLI